MYNRLHSQKGLHPMAKSLYEWGFEIKFTTLNGAGESTNGVASGCVIPDCEPVPAVAYGVTIDGLSCNQNSHGPAVEKSLDRHKKSVSMRNTSY